MAIDSAADLAVFFDTDEHAVAATFTPDGGSAVSVTVIHDQPTESAGIAADVGLASINRVALLRVSEVEAPVPGDSLEIDSVTYNVKSARQDEGGTIWRLELAG